MLSHFPHRKSQIITQKYHKLEPLSSFKVLNTKIWEKYFKIYIKYSSLLQMNSFYLNFFIFSKKKLLRNIRSCSEYLTLFTVYRMFTLRNLVSTIMKARAYRMYKILTGSQDDSGSWPKDIFCKRYLVSLCLGVSLCPRLHYTFQIQSLLKNMAITLLPPEKFGNINLSAYSFIKNNLWP